MTNDKCKEMRGHKQLLRKGIKGLRSQAGFERFKVRRNVHIQTMRKGKLEFEKDIINVINQSSSITILRLQVEIKLASSRTITLH